jgi:hypothetical protein
MMTSRVHHPVIKRVRVRRVGLREHVHRIKHKHVRVGMFGHPTPAGAFTESADGSVA